LVYNYFSKTQRANLHDFNVKQKAFEINSKACKVKALLEKVIFSK